MNAPLLPTRQQPGMLENAQMPGYGWQRNIERRCQLPRGRFPMGELFQDAAANGVRQGSKRRVERTGCMLNH